MRLDAGLTLAQVAGPDLTRQAVQRIEVGKARPSRRTLETIARRLGVPMSTFLAGSDQSEGRDDVQCPDVRAAMELGMAMLREPTVSKARAMDHYHVGQLLVRLNRPDEALVQLHQARLLFEESDDPWLTAEAMDWAAGALYLKEDPRALAVVQEALRLYRTLGHRLPGTEARMLERVAAILARSEAYRRAFAQYEEALTVGGLVRDPVRAGRVSYGLSKCYEHFGDLDRAVELAEEAVACCSSEQDQLLLARAEQRLGAVLIRKGRLDHGEDRIQTALSRAETAGGRQMRSHFLLRLGDLRAIEDCLDEAYRLVTDAIRLATRLGALLALVTGHQQLGELQARAGDHRSSDASFRRALLLAGQVGVPERRAQVLAVYARVREARR